jgi:hypothetical protein
MPDTHCAKPILRGPARANPCAMIFLVPGNREPEAHVAPRDCGRITPMMFVHRSTVLVRPILLLLVSLSLPAWTRSATLEDSAKEFAGKIASAISAQGARGNISFELRNTSSLRPDEAARIDLAIRADLEERGMHVSPSSDSETKMAITLAQNWRDLVWTANVRVADTTETVVLSIPRTMADSLANPSRATLHSEKFWEGAEHVLDVVRGEGPGGQIITALLLPDKLVVQESTGRLEIPFSATPARDPIGKLGSVGVGSATWFAVPPGLCKVDLDTPRGAPECLAKEEQDRPMEGRYPLMIDGAPAGPLPAGKGTELVIVPVCGGVSQFLATSDRDDTQTDTVQLFGMESGGPVAISGELNFPGPVLALHSAPDAPRAIARNLSTGNYEAYRLAISCAQ